MNFKKFTIKSQEAISKGQQLAMDHGQMQIGTEHVFQALITDSEGTAPARISGSCVCFQ